MAAGANLLRVRSEFDDRAGPKIDTLRGRFDRLAGSKGAQAVMQGVGMGAGISAWGLLDRAISGVIDLGAGMVTAAMEEETGIHKLTQALEANVNAWDGNIDAIEAVIREREKLAFSDDEQRNSLALLTARTKDVNEALKVQRLAMDLARLKGIDLATASEVLGKVWSGNTAILNRYGIAVTKGATGTEALAEVQAATAGQAEAFANTTTGALQSMQMVIEDVGEDIGEELLPVIKDVALWTRDDLVPAIQKAIDVLKDAGPIIEDFAAGLRFAIDMPGFMRDMKMGEAEAQAMANRTRDRLQLIQADIAAGYSGMVSGFGRVRVATNRADSTLDDLRETAQVTARAFDRLETEAEQAVDALLELALGPEELKNELWLAKDALREQERELDRLTGKKPSADVREDIHETKGEVIDSQREVIRLTSRLEAMGQLKPGTTQTTIEKLLGKTAALTDEALRAYSALRLVTNYGRQLGAIPHGALNPEGLASGGLAPAGWVGKVGEDGPETLIQFPGGGGYVVPNRGSATAGGDRGATVVHTQINLDGAVVARVVSRHQDQDFAAAPRSGYAG